MSLSTSFTNAWKTAGALVRPKVITRYSGGVEGSIDPDQVVTVAEIKFCEYGCRRKLEAMRGKGYC